jgi:hypothetical protein
MSKISGTTVHHGLSWYVIGIFSFAIEAMLGINSAFLVHENMHVVSQQLLTETFLSPFAATIALVISLAFGACLVAGGMWMFTGFLDSLDDARAYGDHYGASWQWPVLLVFFVAASIILLDLATLMFRAAFFAEKGAVWLLVFFAVLIPVPAILGVLMHVLEQTPRDRRLAKAHQYASSLEVADVTAAIQAMDADLRSRYLEGDDDALKEHYQRVETMRQEGAAYEQARIEQRKQKQAQKYTPGNAKRPFPRAVL